MIMILINRITETSLNFFESNNSAPTNIPFSPQEPEGNVGQCLSAFVKDDTWYLYHVSLYHVTQ